MRLLSSLDAQDTRSVLASHLFFVVFICICIELNTSAESTTRLYQYQELSDTFFTKTMSGQCTARFQITEHNDIILPYSLKNPLLHFETRRQTTGQRTEWYHLANSIVEEYQCTIRYPLLHLFKQDVRPLDRVVSFSQFNDRRISTHYQ